MLYVDHRERKKKDINFSIPNILTRMGVEYKKRLNEVGDYVIIGDILTACIELKNADDYVSSIIDGRLNDELLSMSANYDYNILLVYGSPSIALLESKMKRNIWFNFLAGCVTDISPVGKMSHISVINVESSIDAAQFIKTMTNKIESGDIYREPTAKKIKVPSGQEQLYSTIWMFPVECHIGKKRASLLLNRFGSIRALSCASVEELIEIDGIGKGIANSIVEHITKTVRYSNEE